MKQINEEQMIERVFELAERFVKAQEDIAQCLSDIGLRTLNPTGGSAPGALEKVAMEFEGVKHALADIATSLTQVSDSIDTLAPAAEDDE